MTSPGEVLYWSSTPSGLVPARPASSVSTRLDPEPAPDATLRPAASPPDIDHPCASAPEARLSLNVTSIVLREVAFADAMVGAMPSDTGMDERAARALDAGSAIAPEPEPESLPTSPAKVLYWRSTPSGLVSSMLELRVSTVVVPLDTAVLESTVRPAASPPDTDHPCALVSETDKASLNVTSMVLSEVALADAMVGAMPSDTVTCGDTVDRSGLLDASWMSPGLRTYCSWSDGDVVVRAGEMSSVTEFDEAPGYAVTVLPAESVPCSFQVPSASVAEPVTVSVNVTSIWLAEMASADAMAGAKSCVTLTVCDASALSDSSSTSPPP